MINEKKKSTKNNLKLIMENNNWTSDYVSKMSGLDPKTIDSIKNDMYSIISSNSLMSITDNLDININDLIESSEILEKSMYKLDKTNFNESLSSTLYKYTGTHFKILPYDHLCVSVYSKYLRKLHFKGNFRINEDNKFNITLNIIDFDFYVDKNYFKISIEDFINNIIEALEEYSKNLGIKKIIYNIDSHVRNLKGYKNDILFYQNTDDLVLNALFHNKYINCKYDKKDILINNINELFVKLGDDFIATLNKKL